MMAFTHVGATLVLGLLLGRTRLARRAAPGRRGRWGRAEWALALGFGAAVDLDHVLLLPRYVREAGAGGLAPGPMAAWGASWQGFMHDPAWAVPVVLLASALAAGSGRPSRAAIPALFWGLHMLQDFVVATRWVRFGSAAEWAIVAALAVAAFALARADRADPLASPRADALP